jgi:hypothetical protein
MRLLDNSFSYDLNVDSFIDEFDRFDEFDLELISRDYHESFKEKNEIKYIDEKY